MSQESQGAARFLGGFRELPHGRADGPSLRAAVGDRAGPDELAIVRYLRNGAVLAVSGSAVPDVLSADHELIDSLHLHTDGLWFWYSDLAHYVERYHVALDEEFVEHARRRNFTPPQLSEADLIGLSETLLDGEEA